MTQLRPPWEVPLSEVKPTSEIEHRAKNPPPEQEAEEVEAVPVRAIYLRAGDHLERMRPQDRMLRETFVSEYMFDFNEVAAAYRVGFKGQSAKASAKKLMAEPGVQRLIRERMQRLDIANELNAERVISGLLHEANRTGYGSSHAARVAAWNSLAKIVLPDTRDPGTTVNVPGGVMLIPATAPLDTWEQDATKSQGDLKADVTR